MTTPQDEPNGDQPPAPTVSTTPTSGTIAPPPSSRWWGKLPDHLGRARTSTVILCVLFLAIGLLYLNVRPDPVGTRPARGSGDVEAPLQPTEPSEPATPETTSEPEPADDPEETGAPTTSRPSGSSTPSSEPTEPTGEPTEPTGTSEPTGGTTEPETPAPSSGP